MAFKLGPIVKSLPEIKILWLSRWDLTQVKILFWHFSFGRRNTEQNEKSRSKKFKMGPKNRGQNIVLISLLEPKLEKNEVIILISLRTEAKK